MSLERVLFAVAVVAALFFGKWWGGAGASAGSGLGGGGGARGGEVAAVPPAGRSTAPPADEGGGGRARRSVPVIEAIEAMMNDTVPPRRLRAFEEMLDRMDPSDGPELVALIKEWDKRGVSHGKEWEMLWTRWGEVDGESALRFIGENSEGWSSAGRGTAAYRSLLMWATVDPRAALSFYESGEADGLSPHLQKALVEGWSWTDNDGATDYVLGLDDDVDGKSTFLTMIVGGNARAGGADQVLGWFERQRGSEAGERARAMIGGNVVKRLMAGNPERAVDWLAGQVGEAWLSADTVRSTATEYSRKRSVGEALDWVGSLPTGDEDALGGIKSTIGYFARRDRGAVNGWLEGMRGDERFDDYVVWFVEGFASVDQVDAAVWAQEIGDEAKREAVLDLIVRATGK